VTEDKPHPRNALCDCSANELLLERVDHARAGETGEQRGRSSGEHGDRKQKIDPIRRNGGAFIGKWLPRLRKLVELAAINVNQYRREHEGRNGNSERADRQDSPVREFVLLDRRGGTKENADDAREQDRGKSGARGHRHVALEDVSDWLLRSVVARAEIEVGGFGKEIDVSNRPRLVEPHLMADARDGLQRSFVSRADEGGVAGGRHIRHESDERYEEEAEHADREAEEDGAS